MQFHLFRSCDPVFWARIVRHQSTLLLSACDEEHLGKTYREGRAVLRVTREYYGGRLIDGDELRSLLTKADIIALVGERAISVAVELGIADWRFVKRFQGVPHLNIYRLGI